MLIKVEILTHADMVEILTQSDMVETLTHIDIEKFWPTLIC
jgi:hypothetical protein